MSSGFPNRSHTNRAVKQEKMARGLKFRIYEVEGWYYLCSKNKGADQLRGQREADLVFVFAFAKIRFSHEAARVIKTKTLMNWSAFNSMHSG